MNLDWSANDKRNDNYLIFSVQKTDLSWIDFGIHNTGDTTIDKLLDGFAANPVQYKYSWQPDGGYYSTSSAVIWKNLETISASGGDKADFLVYQNGTKYEGKGGGDTFFADFSSWFEAVTWVNGKNATSSSLSDEIVNALGATHQVKVSGMERLLLLTGSSNDSITQNVTNTNDEFRTNAGNDAINAGDGNDSIDAGSGDDTLTQV
ncbi:MAG: hypothetical protein QX199_09880 [Methylococcaceae bacterium]